MAAIAAFFLLLLPAQFSGQARDDADVSALMRAARDGERGNVQALLQQPVDIQATDSEGWTALIYAAAKGDPAIVKLLLDKGADVNARTTSGYTALAAAVGYGNSAAAKLLVENGADINVRTESGNTLLMAAVISGDSGLVKYLISKGADVNAAARDGRTALTVAVHEGHAGIAELLKKSGAVESAGAPKNDTTASNKLETRPLPRNNPEPSYTTRALKQGIEGKVFVRVLVGADGTVKKVRVLRGLPSGLSYQAMDAAYQLRFTPATKGGQPVDFWQSVQIEFHIKR